MKLKVLVLLGLIVELLSSCSNSSSTTKQLLSDSAVEHASVNDVVIDKIKIDTVDFYPNILEDSLPLKVLFNDVYSDQELLPLIRKFNWWALETDSTETNFSISKANFKLSRTSEPMGDENDSSWILLTNANSSSILFYFAGSKNIKAHKVETISNSPMRIMPGEEKVIEFKNQSYTLRATGSLDSNQYGIHPRNYRLIVTKGTASNLLSSAPYFDEAMIEIIFIGDIDGDGLLDFLIDNSHKYSIRKYGLYLSSFANNDECVRLVASRQLTGC